MAILPKGIREKKICTSWSRDFGCDEGNDAGTFVNHDRLANDRDHERGGLSGVLNI